MRQLLNTKTIAAAVSFALLSGGCAQMDTGSAKAKTVVTGSAAGSETQNASAELERCPAPLGTVAVIEDQSSNWYGYLSRDLRLPSTVPVLKLLVQQSNCFVVVERGRGMTTMMGERELEKSGELRNKSNFGKGQMVSADYGISPSITFSNSDAGGIGGALGGFGGWLGVAGAVAGSMKFKEASTVLTLIDNRSGVQLAAAEGSARNTDFGALGAIFGSSGMGSLGGYSRTAEGKVLVAAFTDSFNGMVRAVRNYKAQEVKGGLGTGGVLRTQGDPNKKK